jgi:exodeoxyribonuclease VII small subunit
MCPGEGVLVTTTEQHADEPRPSYEEAREELAEVVRALEAGGVTLEQSLALWERGEVLAAICQEWLDGARARLDVAHVDDAEPLPTDDANE